MAEDTPCFTEDFMFEYYSSIHAKHLETKGEQHTKTIDALIMMGAGLIKDEKLDLALEHFVHVLAVVKERFGEKDIKAINIKHVIGNIYRKQNKLQEAYSCYMDVCKTLTLQEGVYHRYTLKVKESLASLLREQHEYNKALVQYADLYNSLNTQYGEINLRTAKARFWVGRVFMYLENNEMALHHLSAVLPVFVEMVGGKKMKKQLSLGIIFTNYRLKITNTLVVNVVLLCRMFIFNIVLFFCLFGRMFLAWLHV